jgi:hypothetical protein
MENMVSINGIVMQSKTTKELYQYNHAHPILEDRSMTQNLLEQEADKVVYKKILHNSRYLDFVLEHTTFVVDCYFGQQIARRVDTFISGDFHESWNTSKPWNTVRETVENYITIGKTAQPVG